MFSVDAVWSPAGDVGACTDEDVRDAVCDWDDSVCWA